jgi:hypothetical protein
MLLPQNLDDVIHRFLLRSNSKGCLDDVDLVVRAAIVCSFGQYFGQLTPFGLSSSSCADSCLLSQFEQQR